MSALHPVIAITGSSKEVLTEEVKPVLKRFLAERGLELSEEKTTTFHIQDGFDFLAGVSPNG